MKFKKAISLILAGCMLTGIVSVTVAAETQRAKVQSVYNDVDSSAWYAKAVEYAYDYGLMSGHAGKFDPEGNMNRAMLVTTLYRLSGSPTVIDKTPTQKFQDVEAGSWYEDSVCWAYNTGVTTGYTGVPMFGTNDEVQRQQLAVFLYRYAGNYGIDTSVTTDISGYKNYEMIDEYAKEAMAWAVATKMISGIEYTDEVTGKKIYDLAPHGSATRAQLAMILMRFGTYCENYDDYDFDGVEIKVFGYAWESVKRTEIWYVEAVKSVEKKYNVHFTYVDMLDDYEDDEMDEVIINSVKAGAPCVDIITLNSENMFGCMANGVLYDMTNYVDNLGVKPIYVEAGTWQDRCYGVSYNRLGDSWTLVYDRDYLEEIGMEKTPTDMFMEGKWSYDDFEVYCTEMKAKLPEGVYPIGMYPYHWAVMAAGANGTAVADMDCNVGLMDEAYIEALEFYLEMEEKGLAYPMKEYKDENGNYIQDIAYRISDECIVMKKAEAWELYAGLDFNYGITYWPWGSNVSCDGDYTNLSDNYKVSTTYWSVDSIISDSCDKLGIPGHVMIQIIYDFWTVLHGGDIDYMHEAYQVRAKNTNTEQDAQLYQWGGSRIRMDAGWALNSGEILWTWKSSGDVLLRHKEVRETNKLYYQMAKEALEKYGIAIGSVVGGWSNNLEAYAQKYSYLYGQTYNGYAQKTNISGGVPKHDVSEVPIGKIAYYIEDFDDDGADELLIISFGEEHSLVLQIYEQKGIEVILTDELDLKGEGIFITSLINGERSKPSIVDCFAYGDEKIHIGIETAELAGLFSDGCTFRFVSVGYNGNELLVEASAVSGGSAGDYDSRYMSELAKVDIVPSYDKIFNRERQVFNYVEYYTDMMRITTSYIVDDAVEDWYENSTSPLKCSQIYFSTPVELIKNTSEVREVNAKYAKAAIDAYKKVLLRYPKSKYTLYDIDKNGTPEMIINENYRTYYIYTFDGDSSIFCEEFDLRYAECLYEYDGNGLIVRDGGIGYLHLEYVTLYTLKDDILEYSETLIGDGLYEYVDEYLKSYMPIRDFYDANDYRLLETINN